MSKFSRFMKPNKKKRENGFYAPTESLCDEATGEPVKWEFRHLTSKEIDDLRDSCTVDVQVKGKPNLYRPKINSSKYLNKIICASTVFPDLYDSELQDSYGVHAPEELLYALVDNPGEYSDLSEWMQKFQGFSKTLDDLVEEAKN